MVTQPPHADYLFGDDALAARRLEVLARVYRKSTRDFLLEAAPRAPALALDLGCGPGLSTHLLAETVGARRVVGLDSSEAFLARARLRESSVIGFVLHDVTRGPFPLGPADLVYCRFLLPHVLRPAEAVGTWIGQLRPRGRLLIEEVEWIRTEVPVFSTYLALVAATLRDQEKELYVGPLLDRIAVEPSGRRVSSRVARVPVATRDAATLFSMNLLSLRERAFVRSRYSSDAIRELGLELEELARSALTGSEIEWGLRQIVFERGET